MIAVLGRTGMLGSMLVRTISGEMYAPDRTMFDAEFSNPGFLRGFTWVINAIGVIKPYTNDVARSIRVNALFPHTLPAQTIQIATDCVYSGKKGSYVETDIHDPIDVYGKTKSLGEAPHIKNLRCSIIGPDNPVSLLDWFLAQQDTVSGFTNHLWNGITTYHFAKICQAIIDNKLELPNLQHIVPGDVMTKSQLLQCIAQVYKKDIIIREEEAPEAIDRTLSTCNPNLNKKLWQLAGYDAPPTIETMIKELYEVTHANRD